MPSSLLYDTGEWSGLRVVVKNELLRGHALRTIHVRLFHLKEQHEHLYHKLYIPVITCVHNLSLLFTNYSNRHYNTVTGTNPGLLFPGISKGLSKLCLVAFPISAASLLPRHPLPIRLLCSVSSRHSSLRWGLLVVAESEEIAVTSVGFQISNNQN